MKNKIQKYRLLAGLSQEQAAEALGVAISTYRNWEYGYRDAKSDVLMKIADLFRCTVDELLGLNLLDTTSKLIPMTRTAPVYGKIAAGIPMEAQQELSYMQVPDRFHGNGKEYFFLIVDGDSMNRIIHDGHYALIEKTYDIKNGDIAAVIINGYNATLKLWHKTVTGTVVLSPASFNEKHQDLVFCPTDEEQTTISVLGKVVWSMSPNL